MSSVWDMILQWGSTIKVSIELPVATRHRSDMTEKLLKATLNPNTHTHTHTSWPGSFDLHETIYAANTRPGQNMVNTYQVKSEKDQKSEAKLFYIA